MRSVTSVCIGIQARSTSTRLPNKAFEMIGDRPMLRWVIDAAKSASSYINKHTHSSGVMSSVALLCPYGDEIARAFRGGIAVLEGPEHDVLARYHIAAEKFQPDFMVRITGDCPLIPDALIQNQIKCAVMNQYDYFSNVDPRVRMAADGLDCEIMSRKMLDWAHATATDSDDRQHVTTIIRRQPPYWAKISHQLSKVPTKNLGKLSVDTPEDLERVRAVVADTEELERMAKELAGANRVHWF